MQHDTLALRRWLNDHKKANVPLDINELDSFSSPGVLPGIAAWGSQVAKYTEWALCTPSLLVDNVQPYAWGAISSPYDPWYAMFTPTVKQTPYASAYLAEIRKLTTKGCPIPATAPKRKPNSKGSIGLAVKVSRHIVHRKTSRARPTYGKRR